MADRKIYFCGSIRGGRELAQTYRVIIGIIGEYGKVLTEHLGSDEEIESKDRVLSDREIHDRDLQWIIESDMLVAEVTVPSLGVGYEIGRAVEMKKPILCLFQTGGERRLSAMIGGIEGIRIHHYEDPQSLRDTIRSFVGDQD